MKYVFSGHVFKRMAERRISPDTVKDVIRNGMVIKEYPDTEYIITVYEPNTQLWTSDFTERRN